MTTEALTWRRCEVCRLRFLRLHEDTGEVAKLLQKMDLCFECIRLAETGKTEELLRLQQASKAAEAGGP